jgi:ABC-type sulfate transport system permease subunit
VGLNLVFGLVAAWAIAKFDFPGKTFLITLIAKTVLERHLDEGQDPSDH